MASSKKKNKPKELPALFGFGKKVRSNDGKIRLKLIWPRVIAAMMLLAALGWAAKSAGAYAWFKYKRGFEGMTFADGIAFPLNRVDVRMRLGDERIQTGLDLLKNGNVQEAFQMLRHGVQLNGENLKGRMAYAQLLSGLRPDLAIEAVEGGVRYADALGEDATEEEREAVFAYYYDAIRLFFRLNEDERVIDLAERKMPETPEITKLNLLFALTAAEANLYRGNLDEAERLIREYKLENRLDGMLLASQINWRRGYQAMAIAKLKTFAQTHSNMDMDGVYAQLAEFSILQEDYETAGKHTRQRIMNNPDNVMAKIAMLTIYWKDGEKERVRREADIIIAAESDNANAMIALQNFAATHGVADLADRVLAIANKNNFESAAFTILQIKAHLVAENYQRVDEICEDVVRNQSDWLARYNMPLYGMRALAYFKMGKNDLGAIYLEQALKSARVRNETMIDLASQFIEMGQSREATQILARAIELNPRNQAALTMLVEMQLDQVAPEGIIDNIRLLLTLRHPSYTLLERIHKSLLSDRFILNRERDGLLIEIEAILEKYGRKA